MVNHYPAGYFPTYKGSGQIVKKKNIRRIPCLRHSDRCPLKRLWDRRLIPEHFTDNSETTLRCHVSLIKYVVGNRPKRPLGLPDLCVPSLAEGGGWGWGFNVPIINVVSEPDRLLSMGMLAFISFDFVSTWRLYDLTFLPVCHLTFILFNLLTWISAFDFFIFYFLQFHFYLFDFSLFRLFTFCCFDFRHFVFFSIWLSVFWLLAYLTSCFLTFYVFDFLSFDFLFFWLCVLESSGRAGTMGLILKSFETWWCQRDYLVSLWCLAAQAPPGGDNLAYVEIFMLSCDGFGLTHYCICCIYI